MRQTQNKKDKDKVAVVLMLCFCVIALTSIFTVKANIDKIKENNQNIPVAEEVESEQKERPSKEKQNQKATSNEAEASTNIPTIDSNNHKSTSSEFIHPLNDPEAAVTTPYAMDSLVYSITLDQYMTHPGIDIKASEDAQVVAVQEGTVTSIYQDDRYGTSIEITHPNKIITLYSNLSTSEMVEIGDVVTQGQVIAGVGSTGLFESAEPSHLHFEMTKDGAYVNPADYITF